eukprot:6921376-Karenia_brevis.AAC.1
MGQQGQVKNHIVYLEYSQENHIDYQDQRRNKDFKTRRFHKAQLENCQIHRQLILWKHHEDHIKWQVQYHQIIHRQDLHLLAKRTPRAAERRQRRAPAERENLRYDNRRARNNWSKR